MTKRFEATILANASLGVPSGKTLSDVDEEALTKLLGEDDINQILSKTKSAPEWI